MDYFIEKVLGFKGYVRYVDDFVILNEDRDRLVSTINEIEEFLNNELLLKLCMDKVFIHKVEHGLDFLGYFIKPTHTLVRRKVVRRFKKVFYDEIIDKRDGLIKVKNLSRLTSYKGHCIHANSFYLLKKMDIF